MEPWVVAIDGGGSKVAGAIARLHAPTPSRGALYGAVFRHSSVGTGSVELKTWESARTNLIAVFERLLRCADVRSDQVAHAVLMLAGAGRPEDVMRAQGSLLEDPLLQACACLTVTSDIQPLLLQTHNVTPSLPAIVVIAGTGSLVAALDAAGNLVRAGGWGPVLGDEGSGWRIAQDALRSICNWIDCDSPRQGTPAVLEPVMRFLMEKQLLAKSSELNSALLALTRERGLAAQMVPAILELASQPTGGEALSIVRAQIQALALQVEQVHRRLGIAGANWRLCLSGGLAANHRLFQDLLRDELGQRQISPSSVVMLDALDAALSCAARIGIDDALYTFGTCRK